MEQQKQEVSVAEQRLADEIKELGPLLSNPTLNRAVLSEENFVKVFLPMFAGLPTAHPDITPNTWLNVARGPFNEVTVVDAKGVKLFDVPPYFAQDHSKPLDGTGPDAHMPSVSNMLMNARLLSSRGPTAMQNYIDSEMDRRKHMFGNEGDHTGDIVRWNEIFKRYNLPEISLTAQAQNNNVDPTRDSQEFDPL